MNLIELGIICILGTAHFTVDANYGTAAKWEHMTVVSETRQKTSSQISPILKREGDMIYICQVKKHFRLRNRYKVTKNKMHRSGTRTMYTTLHPCWVTQKNRHKSTGQMPFEYETNCTVDLNIYMHRLKRLHRQSAPHNRADCFTGIHTTQKTQLPNRAD